MLHIHLFGYLRLLVDDQPFRFKSLPKTALILTYLLLNRESAVSRDHLAFLLWDDVSEKEARANLRRHLHDLLRALPDGEDWLLRDMKTVQWNPAVPFWLDIAEFERLCQETDRLTEAAALYTGDLMQAMYEDWIVVERDRFQALYISTLARLLNRERERGDLFQAMNYARQLLSRDPYREDILRDYMRLRHASGDRAGMAQLYQQFKERLAEELGVDPMEETTALHDELFNNLTPVPLPAPIAVPAPANLPPTNLPARLTSFVGRYDELSQLGTMISSPDSPIRLVTITGSGGTGKTRLAIETASKIRDEQPELFPDGFYFVGLAAVTSPEQVLDKIAESLEIRGNPGLTVLDNLKVNLRDKRLLLVLDNFEHLLEAAPLLAELLTAVPDLRLLVTSQALLHLYGEHEFPLLPLALPDKDSLPLLADLLNYAAIRLFVERIQAVQPKFQLTTENSAAIIDICRRLDGMPLALELAAARGKMLSPAAMLAQLSQRLNFLSSRSRNLPSRHQTLRATIDWSYKLLIPAEQSLFACVALFAGSFTAAAAQAVYCPEDTVSSSDIFDLIDSLVDRNMIRPLMVEGNEAPRFRMLQTLREYGLEQLSQMETAVDYQRRFAGYYVELAEESYAGLLSADQPRWLQWILEETNNLNAALTYLNEEQTGDQAAESIGRMVVALTRFWQVQGRTRETRYWLEQARNHLVHLPPELQIRLLNESGNIAQVEGDYPKAEAEHQQALAVAREAKIEDQEAHTLHFLAFAAGRQGHYDKAKILFQECLTFYRRLIEVSPIQVTRLLNNLAIVHKRLGEYDEAIALLKETLALKREINDHLGLPASLANLGNLLVLQGDPLAAAIHFEEALKLRQQMQDRPGMLLSIAQIANLAVVEGRFGQAAALYAADDNLRQVMSIVRTADVESDYQRDMALIQRELSTAELYERQTMGRSMTLEQAADFALNSLTLPLTPTP